jgi:hypothetical protein
MPLAYWPNWNVRYALDTTDKELILNQKIENKK